MYEASAKEMLREQRIPVKFQNAKIMKDVIEAEFETSMNDQLTVGMNFDVEEKLLNSKKSHGSGSCLACGNCLTGCPYNAKNSTDVTYLASAVEAGCHIKTECEVQYVVRNQEKNCIDEKMEGRSRRRWLVYLNEFDCVAADFVVLSAGVFGTAKILFQSKMRGLKVSEKLGSGLSFNGNNVAYLARSSANLNTYALNRKQLSKIPFQERPGPSISSSFTSSSGFTIQSAVIPTAYPCLLFEGLTTYGWQSSFWFLHKIVDKIKHFIGLKCRQGMVLNAMGYDDNNGTLTFDNVTKKILFKPPRDPLLPRKIETFKKLADKLGGTLLMSCYRSTSVHHLGGCAAAKDFSSGVCNPDGQVFDPTSPLGVYPGLYICDASMIPCSVGINPCLTIAVVAEHVSRHLMQDTVKYNSSFAKGCCDRKQDLIINHDEKKMRDDSKVMIKETMRGQVGGMVCSAHLKFKFKTSPNLEKTCIRMGVSHPLLRGKVGGYVVCKGLEMDELHVIKGEVDLCKTDSKTPYTQYMHYHLLLAGSSGSRYVLGGIKILNPYLLALNAWSESTTLHVTLRKITMNITEEQKTSLKGELHISFTELLKSLYSLEGGSRSRFMQIFMRSLFRTYILQKPRESRANFSPIKTARGPYPSSTNHEIITEDGLEINCQHWECVNHIPPESAKRTYPVFLINGYSTESFCLSTEPNDLVRTLLQEGHDVWLLHARLHSLNPPNNLSIKDIGEVDIPAGINMISKFYGESVKVHVVAHCVGGLAIHIALMGGFVSAKRIASLSCTNSSMFFKLTTSSLIKMWLPLVPMCMAIMGRNGTLPLLQASTITPRHMLLKSIARLIPRYERCICDECEVFSGIFGNTFWHQNISHTMHHWMNKENLRQLPMAAFPHLRKICNAGFIVDEKGKNSYLIHPERMALPTLYISGGRSILVTPETSFLANKYMKLHQPYHIHERVVVKGYGHSDLLIGEESNVKVFPHIVNHMRLAEKEKDPSVSLVVKKYKKEVLEWSNDPYKDRRRFGDCAFNLITILLFVLLFKCLISQLFSNFA
ncbi:uncharacterized protein [Henckelia pumila]|uniref:uncharacterized protein n=1 Tax=Henckelia pumila TaxID=405737 RepID=UPI003C6E3B68